MKMKTTSFNRVFCAGMILICATGVSRGQGSRIEKVLDSTRNSLTTQALPFDVEDGMFDPATGNFFGYAKAKVDAAKVHSQTRLRKNTMRLKQEKRKLLMDLLDAKRRKPDGEDADACVTLLTESLNEIQQEIDDNEHKIAELEPEQQQ